MARIPKSMQKYVSGPSDSSVALEKWVAGKLTDGEYALERHRIANMHYRALIERIPKD